MQHKFWLAKPYGLANQQLCYIQIHRIWRQIRIFFRILGENEPISMFVYLEILQNNHYEKSDWFCVLMLACIW